jgi:hypothetical protein
MAFQYVDASGDRGTFFGNDFAAFGAAGRLCVAHLVADATDVRLYSMGELLFISAIDTAIVPGTYGAAVGVSADPAAGLGPHLQQFNGGVRGVAYGEHYMTADEVTAHYIECIDAGTMVEDPGAGAFINRYDMSVLAAGAAPATIPNLGSGGAVPLTLNGALTVVDRYPFNHLPGSDT